MQKPLFTLLWLFISFLPLPTLPLSAQSTIEKLIEIDLEIDLLQKQLEMLEKQADSNYHKEMVEELSSQQNMRSYEWSTFSHHLENAEAYEESARREEKMIEAIKARLHHLAEQLRTLLPDHR